MKKAKGTQIEVDIKLYLSSSTYEEIPQRNMCDRFQIGGTH